MSVSRRHGRGGIQHAARQRRDVVILLKGGHHPLAARANSLVEARATDLGEGGALDERACDRLASGSDGAFACRPGTAAGRVAGPRGRPGVHSLDAGA